MTLNTVLTADPALLAQPSPEKDSFRLQFSVRAYAGKEVLFQFTSQYEVPLGMRREHLHATAKANEMFFEHAIEQPTMLAMKQVIGTRYHAGYQPPLPAAEPEKVSPPGQVNSDPAFAELGSDLPPLPKLALPKPPFIPPYFPPASKFATPDSGDPLASAVLFSKRPEFKHAA